MSEQFTLNVIDVMAQGIRRVKAWLDPMNPAPDPHTIKDIRCTTYECEDVVNNFTPARYFTEYEYTRYVPLGDAYGRIKFKGVVAKFTPEANQMRVALTLTVNNSFTASDDSSTPTIVVDVPKRKKPHQAKQRSARDLIYQIEVYLDFDDENEDNIFYMIDYPTVTFYNPRPFGASKKKARVRSYKVMRDHYPHYNFGLVDIIHTDATTATLRSKFPHALGILNNQNKEKEAHNHEQENQGIQEGTGCIQREEGDQAD